MIGVDIQGAVGYMFCDDEKWCMISGQISSVNPCWLFLNQYQHDAETELFNGSNGADFSAEDSFR